MIGLKCPYCGYDRTEVQATNRRVDSIKRLRICLNCGETFTTVENFADECAKPKRGRPRKRKSR